MLVRGWLVGALLCSAPASEDAGAPTEPASSGETASADARTALLDRLHLAGEATADMEAMIRRAVLRGLEGEGVRVIEPPEDTAPTPCSDASCFAARAAASDADYVIDGQIRVSQRNYEVSLALHGRDGRTLATRSVNCPICSMPEVEAAVSAGAIELAGAAKSARAQKSLSVTSGPSGALVYVDGALVGTTPFTQPLPPGEHRIELKKDGYLDQAVTLTIAPDVAPEPVAVTLVPRKTPSGLAPLGWAALGLGGASVITGVALLVLDENPYKGLCEGEYMDTAGRCRFQYNTLAGGVAGVVAGLALIGGGTALVVLDRQQRAPTRKASAQLRFGVHPRGLTLSGRF